ncbi:uncharacterized protein LOC113324353 [Papaver somniferum]|uniref:uncharacterized protein LOC113324353 n=1 Tax=Papaver somniferum TaxID=3469 RepID=UPI000E705008|nr:uncharacterized protein LOC113324353 [Papaver somniferum]
MEKIIAPTQATFVPIRYINDNIIIAHELIHTMKKTRSKKGMLALKLDMSKAFDRIEWPFVDKMLDSMGLCTDWRMLIHQYDCLLFLQVDDKTITNVLNILDNFGKLSGQMINFSKAAAFIAGDVTDERKNQIKIKLGVKELTTSDKYLGLPILLGKSKSISFASLFDAFANRLQGWNPKTLNQAARTTLLKAVLNTISSHYMGNFKIPYCVIKKLDSIQRRFWWGNKTNKGINFIAWKSFNKSKSEGGLAFRDLEQFNNALITKLAWRLRTEPDQLWVKVLKPKYAPYCDFLLLQEDYNNSS